MRLFVVAKLENQTMGAKLSSNDKVNVVYWHIPCFVFSLTRAIVKRQMFLCRNLKSRRTFYNSLSVNFCLHGGKNPEIFICLYCVRKLIYLLVDY